MVSQTNMSATLVAQRPGRAWRLIRPARAVYAGLALLPGSILAFAMLRPFQVLPRIGVSPGFALIDQSGRRLISEDLRGHIVVYNFADTDCAAPCPQTSQVVQAM